MCLYLFIIQLINIHIKNWLKKENLKRNEHFTNCKYSISLHNHSLKLKSFRFIQSKCLVNILHLYKEYKIFNKV